MAWNKFGHPSPACACNCSPSAGPYCLRVAGCSGFIPGATVSLSGGGSTATTDGTGSACLTYPSAGSYTLTITPPAGAGCTSFVTFTQVVTLPAGPSSGGTKFLTLSPGWECCGSGSAMIDIPVGTPLFYNPNCGTIPQSLAQQSSNHCQWGVGGLSGFAVVNYIGNCQWQLTLTSTCSSCGGFAFCSTSVIASGPPSLPVSLTFNDPGDSNFQPPILGCNPPGSPGCGSLINIWPVTVTS